MVNTDCRESPVEEKLECTAFQLKSWPDYLNAKLGVFSVKETSQIYL